MRRSRAIAIVILLVQAVSLHHVALEAHGFDQAGAAFEHESLAREAHETNERGAHVCADVVGAGEATECLAFTATRAPTVEPRQPVSAPLPAVSPSPQPLHPQAAVAQQGVLFVAPKSSPPGSAQLG